MSDPLKRQSLVRFSAFGILAFISMLCVLLAVLVPLVSRYPEAVQTEIWRTVGFAAMFAFLAFVGICGFRWYIEKISGPLVLRPMTVGWIKWLQAGLTVPMMIMIVAFGITVTARTSVVLEEVRPRVGPELVSTDWMSMLFLAVPICFLAAALVMLFWDVSPMSLEVREKGLVVGGKRFIPWSTNPRLEWSRGASPKICILKIIGVKQQLAAIKSTDKEAVNQRLAKLGFEPKPTAELGINV